MTARALRIGVVLGGNLVEERTFADVGPITIGQSLRCRLSVPADGVPHEHALFVRDQGRLLLVLTDRMTGRVAQGGTIEAEPKGSMPIERGARGKLQIGDATILFQEVAAPVRAPRPQLPASVRGTFADRVDRRLALIVGGSLLVHLAIGGWAWMTETEHESLFDSQPVAQYRHETYVIDPPLDVEPTATTQEPGAATPVAPVQTPTPIVRPSRITTPSPEPTLTTGDAERFAQMLTTEDERAGGRNEIGNRLGSELDQQIADIQNNDRPIGNDESGFRNRKKEGIHGDPRPVVNTAGEIAQQVPRIEHAPARIRLQPTTTKAQPDGPSPDRIITKIQTDYMRGLTRCYEQGLRGDHSLRGKVSVTFTVTETGKVSDPTAKGMTSEVDACIATQMASWRFPVMRDAAGEPTDLDIALALALATGN